MMIGCVKVIIDYVFPNRFPPLPYYLCPVAPRTTDVPNSGALTLISAHKSRTNLRFQSLMGITPEGKVVFSSVCRLAKTFVMTNLA